MPNVHVERDLAGDPASVFEWFVDPVLVTRWWPDEAQIEPVVGGRYRMYWSGPDVTLRGDYLAVGPGERLEFTWSWDHEDLPPRHVDVVFTTSHRGTLVAVTHEYESEDEGIGDADGWTHFLAVLDDRISDA